MQLKHLSLTNIRNFSRLDTDVPAGTTLIVGANAQGKTSILEAVYFLATMTSFQAERDQEMINLIEARKSLAVGRIVNEFSRGGQDHRIETRIIKETTRQNSDRTRKEVLVDGVKKKSSDAIGSFNAVLFLPQMMQVVEGSPSHRRHYFDLVISQVTPHYASTLADFRKILQQRNALLKQLYEHSGDSSQLDFWDGRIAKRAAEIIHARIQAVQEIDQIAGKIHHDLTRSKEVLRLSYQPSFDPLPSPNNQMQLLDAPADRGKISIEKIESLLLERLAASRKEEILRGQTTTGPHRDEMRFISNGIDLGIYGSRGQVRSIMMTMKLAEVAWMEQKTGFRPVLLLDEVLAELDPERRSDLLARVTESHQALLTTTDLSQFESGFVKDAKIWNIHQGRLE